MGTCAAFDDQEAMALRWGGLAGMLGSVSLVTVFGLLAALVGLDTVEVEAEIRRYPEIRTIRAVENTMYLFATALLAVHSVAIILALRRTALAPALIGGVMMALGVAILAAGAVPHTATDPIAGLYHGTGATPEVQSGLVLVWSGIQGIVDALVVTGLLLTPVGMGFLGLAMLRSPGFGNGYGWVGLGLALAGAVSAVMILIEPSEIAAIGVFAVIFFHVITGWGTFRLGAAAAGRPG